MGSAHHGSMDIQNPGKLKGAGALSIIFGLFIAVGIAGFLFALKADAERAWASYLRSHFFFLAVSMGAAVFVALQWITTSMWSAPVRRVAEAFTSYIPVILLSTVVLLAFGAHDLYHWTHPDYVKGDLILEGKTGYLNMKFLWIRSLVFVGLWILLTRVLVKRSLGVDHGSSAKSAYQANRVTGVIFLMIFALSFTFTAIDQLKSLDPHWFSTMFGVYIFGGAFQTFFAFLALTVIFLRKAGYLNQLTNENHLHDIAKLMFAFTVFWAYTGFSQYMLIWYANMPEETGYYLLRFNPGWEKHSYFLFAGKFVVPFLALLPRTFKRSENWLAIVSVWIIFMENYEYNWLIQPTFFKNGPIFGWSEVAIWLGFFGIFGLLVVRFLKKNNVVAINDPMLKESVFHHHI